MQKNRKKIRRYYWVWFVTLLIPVTPHSALYGFDLSVTTQQDLNNVVLSTIDCRFDQALAQADSIAKHDPASPLAPFLRLFTLGLRDLDCAGKTQSPAEFTSVYQSSIHSIADYEQKYGRTSFTVMLRGFSQAANATFFLSRQKYLDAIPSGFNALKNLQTAKALDSANDDVDFFLGLYEYARAELKKRMWWVLFWYGGDKASGIKKLETCSEKGRFMGPASQLALIDLYIREKCFDQARGRLVQLQTQFPASRFVLWKRAKYHEARKEYGAAADVYEKLAVSYEQGCPSCGNGLFTRNRQAHMLAEAEKFALARELCGSIINRCASSASDRDICGDTRKLLHRIDKR